MRRGAGAPPGLARRREAGFTLLEVMVAFVVAAIGIAALLRGGGAALVQTQAASRIEEAVSLARSEVAALDAVGDGSGREVSGGDDGPYRWRAVVTPADEAGLYNLTVTVGWREATRDGQVRLATQLLARAP